MCPGGPCGSGWGHSITTPTRPSPALGSSPQMPAWALFPAATLTWGPSGPLYPLAPLLPDGGGRVFWGKQHRYHLPHLFLLLSPTPLQPPGLGTHVLSRVPSFSLVALETRIALGALQVKDRLCLSRAIQCCLQVLVQRFPGRQWPACHSPQGSPLAVRRRRGAGLLCVEVVSVCQGEGAARCA